MEDQWQQKYEYLTDVLYYVLCNSTLVSKIGKKLIG